MLNEKSASMYVCVFTSWTIFCRCFCLRCWHSNTSYTWNTTPAYKTHYYPTWGGILAGVCSALLSIRTLASRRHRWPTRMLRLHHCLSLSNTAVCLVLSLYLSAPPIARDIYFIYIFPMQRVQWKGLASHASASELISQGNHWLVLNFAAIAPSSGFALQSWKWPSAGNSARSSPVWYVNS